MKKRILKLAAFAAALALLAGVLWFSNGLLGNPVSKFLAARAAREYLAGQYPGADYQVESVNYSFKFGGYTAAVVSPHQHRQPLHPGPFHDRAHFVGTATTRWRAAGTPGSG